jgi:hypothetical protein
MLSSFDFPSSIVKMFSLAQLSLQLFNESTIEVKVFVLVDQCQLLSSSSGMPPMKSHHHRHLSRLQRSPSPTKDSSTSLPFL